MNLLARRTSEDFANQLKLTEEQVGKTVLDLTEIPVLREIPTGTWWRETPSDMKREIARF